MERARLSVVIAVLDNESSFRASFASLSADLNSQIEVASATLSLAESLDSEASFADDDMHTHTTRYSDTVAPLGCVSVPGQNLWWPDL
jgi:ribosomal protein S12 methylthiotransferase accessory factor YcaO